MIMASKLKSKQIKEKKTEHMEYSAIEQILLISLAAYSDAGFPNSIIFTCDLVATDLFYHEQVSLIRNMQILL